MILVTGGAGFIGSNFVCDWLGRRDEAVLTLDRLGVAGSLRNLDAVAGDPRHTFVQGDIADSALVADLLARHRPRAIVHCAAESHVDRSIASADAFMHSNILGTYQLLEAARAYTATLEAAARAAFRFLYVSTDEVYGDLAAHAPPAPEAQAYAPSSPYSASKAAGDHLVHAWGRTYGLPVLTTHGANTYGPHQYAEKLIPHVIACALAARPLPIYGDGLQVREWLAVQDHCAALRAVLERGRPGAVYNIASGNALTNLDLVQRLCGLLDALAPRADGKSYAGQIMHVADRPGHDRRYAVDATRLQSELGWHPVVTLEEGLRTTVRWYLEHPAWLAEAQRKSA